MRVRGREVADRVVHHVGGRERLFNDKTARGQMEVRVSIEERPSAGTQLRHADAWHYRQAGRRKKKPHRFEVAGDAGDAGAGRNDGVIEVVVDGVVAEAKTVHQHDCRKEHLDANEKVLVRHGQLAGSDALQAPPTQSTKVSSAAALLRMELKARTPSSLPLTRPRISKMAIMTPWTPRRDGQVE